MKQIPQSELILNADGSIYHLKLLPRDIASTIITVGDPGRVSMVSHFFDKIEVRKRNREFVTHTGYYRGKRLTVISTGIGTDNIDIVFNELDALVNIDLKTRIIKKNLTRLNIIRIGTSGALHDDIEPGSHVFSEFGLGLDGLMNYYKFIFNDDELKMTNAFRKIYPARSGLAFPFIFMGSAKLEKKISKGMIKGITASCSGFYGPQQRMLRGPITPIGLIDTLNKFRYDNYRITNFEMETGAMYGLARVLGHQCCSVNLIVANRINHTFLKNYKTAMNRLIEKVLGRIAG
ncbi:MAG: nucleoside phosphorylase [Bacteroidia bacterium]